MIVADSWFIQMLLLTQEWKV